MTSRIEKYVNSLGSDSLSVFGGKFEGGAHLQQVPDEISPCIQDLLDSDKDIKSYLEVGSAAGGLIVLLNYYFKLKIIALVDDNQHGKAPLRENILKSIDHVEIIGNSQKKEVIKKINDLKVKFDLIMIDADHSFAGISTDFKNYSQFLSSKGFVMFHDTVHWSTPGVKNFIAKLKRNRKYKMIGEYISKIHPDPCGVALFQKA